jgi:hypothetical protein
MNSCLIGYTGFVGSNLVLSHAFSTHINSSNVNTLSGKEFDLIVCAGVSAVKWQANKDPATDRAKIDLLLNALQGVRATCFILISTVDVYPSPVGVDESMDVSLLDNHAYGRNRLLVETFVQKHFDRVHVVRLPALFGSNLKKNVIFDLLNDNCLEAINPQSSFQYYYLANLWRDLQRVVKLNLPLINFATEPVSTKELIDRFFPEKAGMVGLTPAKEAHYDFQSRYASHWNGAGGYLYGRQAVLASMREFLESQGLR